MLTKSAIRKNYIDKYPSISVPTKVAENASVGAQNQRFLNELHGESVKHGLGAWDAAARVHNFSGVHRLVATPRRAADLYAHPWLPEQPFCRRIRLRAGSLS